jgi:hypothetical protein
MAEFTIGSPPWSAVPSIWPKAKICIVDANGTALAHVISAERAPMFLAVPALIAALTAAIAIVREERESFVECQTIAGDPATIALDLLPILHRYDGAISLADSAFSQLGKS